MFDDELDKYETYEEYLDSLVSDEDHKYLEDEEMARQIAELGYRSSGDTLTRDNFYKLKARIAESRLLTMNHEHETFKEELGALRKLSNSRFGLTDADVTKTSSSNLAKFIKARIQPIRKGELLSILFIRTKIPRRNRHSSDGQSSGEIEVSGHIDLAQRMKSENFAPYSEGEKLIVPRRGDLTFYNWSRGSAFCKSNENFEVIAEMPRLRLRHRGTKAMLDITTPNPNLKMSMDSRSTRGSGWQTIDCMEDGTHAMIFDVQILENESTDDEAELELSESEKQ